MLKKSICWYQCFRLCTYEEFLKLESSDLESISALNCKYFLSWALVCVTRWMSSEAACLIPSCRISSAVGLWVSGSSASVQLTIRVFGCWGCSLTAVLGNFLIYEDSCSVLWTWFLWSLSEGSRAQQGRSLAGTPCLSAAAAAPFGAQPGQGGSCFTSTDLGGLQPAVLVN